MGELQSSSPLQREARTRGGTQRRGERGDEGARSAGAGRGPGALPSSGSRLRRRTNARMASGARGTQAAGPACDAAPAARPGLQVARRRMRVTDHRFPRTGAEQRGGGTSPRRPGQRASPGAARRAELAQHCSRAHVPAVVRNLRSWAPRLQRGRLGVVPLGKLLGLGDSDRIAVPGVPGPRL